MSFEEIERVLKSELEPLKFECHPFKIEWYNSHVDARFKLSYENDTLAVLVLNTPAMFETTFLPYLFRTYKNDPNVEQSLIDPIDRCMLEVFSSLKKKLEEMLPGNIQVEVIKDYEIAPDTRRAKIVMQTCAHVSGAAYFYDAKKYCKDVEIPVKSDDPETRKNLMGVCLHPKYGGWFAMRCVFIFRNLLVPELTFKEPIDRLDGDSDRILDVLRKFNYNWRDSSYRNCVPVEDKYSPMQLEYFLLEPKHRKSLIIQWLSYSSVDRLIQTYRETEKNDNLIKNFYFN